jgi:hypothetical protein
MNAYPISPEIKAPKNNHKDLLNPIGERVYPEYETRVAEHIEIQGFGSGKNRLKES